MATKKPSTTEFAGIVSKIQPIHSRETFLAMLVYGRSGTGKTAFASTFPKPMLLMDVREKGTDTVAKVPGIDLVQVDTWEEFEQLYWYLVSGKHEYRTVVIDQISQLQDLAMEKVRRDEGKEPTDLISKRDWGAISGMMKTWLFNYRDLVDKQMHVCMVAHERANAEGEAIEDQIDPSIGPRLMPSVASSVNGAVSIIGNTFIRERFVGTDRTRMVEYCMRIGPHAYYTTKVRTPVGIETPDVLVNPSFEKALKLTQGESLASKKVVKVKSKKE